MMKAKFIFTILFYLFLSGNISAQNWQQITTVEDVCTAYPERMKTMLQTLNLDFPGLEKVKQSYQNNDIPQACKNLLEYYKNGNTAQYLRREQPPVSQKTTTLADSIIQDIYTFQLVTDKVPRLADGHLNWDYTGPEEDIEWAWALNRHYPVSYLLPEYYKTGNPKYARYIDLFIKDWIMESLPYPGVKSNTAMWRGLEIAARVKTWANVFYGFINTDFISPATQLLILSSLPEHEHYARNFHAQGNWLTMEISGLATVATAWPEFKKSKEWLDYSIATMTESLREQVYPDGAQTELTTHYHRVALNNFHLFYTICKRANITLPKYFTGQIENMWNYLAYILRPDGNALLNNDADLDYDRELVIKAAEEYGRKDWQYVATNGKSGVKPKNGPSNIFLWAGHFISRSDYGADAHWSFFDIGPWGSGHQHNDKLHISISAFGRDLLVDAGRFAYRGETAKKFRGYATGSQGHNVILMDGKGQAPGPRLADEPLSEKYFKITPEFDYAWNSFDQFNDLEGKGKHTRTLFYVRGNFWVVVDRVETDRPRKIETLWHWHPDCVVQEGTSGIVSTKNERGNLKIIPVEYKNWKIDLIKGQEKPEIQGWYSKLYNKYEPNVTSIYSTKIDSDETFVWLLVPSEKEAPEMIAKVLSKNDKEIKLEVENKAKGNWKITIPFSNSKNAQLKFSHN
ncbi:MAG: heparinase II/III family protein [Draconibacterium sp.]|nr:heparinase II/III family protein [Draconibacterium sp.]